MTAARAIRSLPGRTAHTFGYNPDELESDYLPPLATELDGGVTSSAEPRFVYRAIHRELPSTATPLR